ncbi:hypothetical protein V5799_013667 [Amblyomma americanum]|uniref:Secreted protein n=1 Tax=Amblyomma americanum TaxID=6943 RepID=A0AAQ4E5B2_AMBAM
MQLPLVFLCVVLSAFAVMAQRSRGSYPYHYREEYPSQNQKDYELYLRHSHCLRRCDAVDRCDGDCVCISRGDFPHVEEGLCFDPRVAIPEHFKGLGYGK